MAEIFISYSREDRDWVERLAAQLLSEGYSVWWDWDLLVGKRYRETIDNELQTCRAAVVVWSQHSIQSDFVRDEAEEAQQRNILVPVLKEIVRPPAGFRQIQTADLSTWTGGGTHAEFRRVMKGIGFMVGRPAAGDSPSAGAAPTPARTMPSPTNPADSANFLKPTAGLVAKTAMTPQSVTQSALMSRLPPASHRIWRYAVFAVVALVGVLLIVTYLPSTVSKPPAPASVIGGAAPPRPAAPAGDEGDIGQTGPHNAPAPPAPPAPSGGNTTGDDGDIGQGPTH